MKNENPVLVVSIAGALTEIKHSLRWKIFCGLEQMLRAIEVMTFCSLKHEAE